MEKSGLIHKEFQDSLANLKNQEIAYISNDGNQRKIETLVNFHNAHRLIKKEEKERSKVNHNTKPAIYFSYAWGDDNEEGESREKIVQELYESLKMDGYNVVRDKEDVGYKGSISDFMKTIGKGNSIIVAISDKYLKSENCMFEMYEIFRNAKLEKEGFIEKIYPIRIESIRLSDPLVLDTYFEHWEKKEKDWEQLIVKRGTRISSEQQEQYRRIKAIAHELGDFLAFLNDINAKTKADLSKNNFEEIKKAITKRVIF